jgi:hypothetical protein
LASQKLFTRSVPGKGIYPFQGGDKHDGEVKGLKIPAEKKI